MEDYNKILDRRWAELYKNLGFTKKDIALYEMPMRDRREGKLAADWRLLDRKITQEVKKSIAPKKYCSGPSGIMDTIELRSVADGKMYDSKSKYYDSLKRSDSHIIEAGEQNLDPNRKYETKGDFNCRKELKQAIEQHLH